ncbi:MFS transporter [Rufibacter sp. LB8]|uniref:MFS transporter n=1 Tax=Rufibacter sp. LB8 TaxID=2777781 RepID=UPI00178C18B4|nr:MFS transporter [Rufibacter sp. LB8]
MSILSRQRVALSVFFFLSGVNFSSWAARIPTIKMNLGLNEAELGSVLLTMPVSSLIGLPLSGWLVSKFETRVPLAAGFLLTCFSLACIPLATTSFSLVAVLFVFSLSMRIFNIAVNTQAINLQKRAEKKINGAFHGLWSTGGIVGVGITTVLVSLNIDMLPHLMTVAGLSAVSALVAFRHLLQKDQAPAGNKLSLRKPDPFILYLGLLIFLAAVCEGGMFDWSGIYFQQVVKEEIFTVGYLVFMTFMALSRFVSDKVVDRLGMPKTYMASGLLIFSGIGLAVLFPSFWPALVGFSMVGFGAASVIPMTYTLAGASPNYSPGIVISLLTTFGIVGMLLGPPMIGYLAHALSLKLSFVTFAVAGLMLVPISRMFFRLPK